MQILLDTKFERLCKWDVGRIIKKEDSQKFPCRLIPFLVLKELKFFRRPELAVLKIRISEDEAAWLDALAKMQGTTKTQIVRSALKKVFEGNFLDKKMILLPEDQYQALVDLVGSPLTRQEIEGRKKLQNVSRWDL